MHRIEIILALLFLAIAAQGQQLQRIAILGTEDDGEPSIGILEQAHLTAKLREAANNVLPKTRYGVMTSESIVERLGSQEQAAKLCREATCLVDLGRKVSADYIAQARIGRFGGNLTIRAELYDVRNGNLLASFTGDSKNVQGLLSLLEEKASVLFRTMPGSITIEDVGGAGILSIKPAYLAGMGVNKKWDLAINGKVYSSFENWLSQGVYDVKLSHECYEDISFKVGINKGSGEIFDMAKHVKVREGILDLRAERGWEFVSEPVFVNGKKIGETPFSGYVPICSKVEIGESMDIVDVKLKYMERVKYVHTFEIDENKVEDLEELSGEGVRFGVRLGFSAYDFYFGYKGLNEGKSRGTGFGAGLALKIPVWSSLSFNTGLDFYYRDLVSREFEISGKEYEDVMREFVISIPALIQFAFIENSPFRMEMGVQLDIPIETSWARYYEYFTSHRAAADFGFVLGLAYMAGPSIGVDFRCVIGFTGLFEDFEDSRVSYDGSSHYKDRSELRQYGLGVVYFF